jgi:Flp pilus assembly protein TadD
MNFTRVAASRVAASQLTMIGVVAASMLALYTVDVLLARVEKQEIHNEAETLFHQGRTSLAAGRPAEAVEPLQRAFAMDRNNRKYQLAYAEALMGAGRNEEAATRLNDAMRRSPNDGKANLLLARLARASGDFANESAYYHRAIYGVWEGDAGDGANAARLEWIRELVARGDRKMLIAELLPLEAATQDFGVLTQVANNLRLAGAPSRSAELYRTLLQTHPGDPVLLKGLGEAETEAGAYAAARSAFVRAFQNNPDDASIRHDMELASALSAIDPTLRRLASSVKHERSMRILRLVRDTVAACGAPDGELVEADRMLRTGGHDRSNEAAEEVLQIAESLWRKRATGCSAPDMLPVLMRKLAQ